MTDLIAKPFPGYALIDSGDGRKLEEIAGLLVDRASPAPLWRPRLATEVWSGAARGRARVTRVWEAEIITEWAPLFPLVFARDPRPLTNQQVLCHHFSLWEGLPNEALLAKCVALRAL